MKVILMFSLMFLSSWTQAADPADYLRSHLAQMEKHLEVMEKYEGSEYLCSDLVEHARQMTLHMEQMTEMMKKMHQAAPRHEMQHNSDTKESE